MERTTSAKKYFFTRKHAETSAFASLFLTSFAMLRRRVAGAPAKNETYHNAMCDFFELGKKKEQTAFLDRRTPGTCQKGRGSGHRTLHKKLTLLIIRRQYIRRVIRTYAADTLKFKMKKLGQSKESKNERDIRRIMIVGTAIGFGFMAASLEALRSSPSGFSFQITARTFLAFALGAAAVVPFWKVVFGLVSGNRTRSRHVWAALLMLLIGVATFLYPTRFVPSAKRHDLYIGLALAVCALSVLAGILIVIGKFLEKDAGQLPDIQIPNDEIPKYPKNDEIRSSKDGGRI